MTTRCGGGFSLRIGEVRGTKWWITCHLCWKEARYVAQHQKQSSCAAVNESRHDGSLVRTHQLANVCLMFMKVASVCNVVHVFV